MSAQREEDRPTFAEFAGETFQQGIAAGVRLDLPLSAYLHWPWAELDTLMGPMAPGEVHYVAAASSVGKTTFVTSFVDAVAERNGGALYVIPTELTPQDWRVWWACFRCGIKPREALQGHLKRRQQAGDLEAAQQRARLRDEMETLCDARGPWAERVYVSDLRTLNEHDVWTALRDAKAFGAKCVLVDHVDQLSDKRNVFQAAGKVAEALMHGAQDMGLTVLATSQLNREAIKGDHLARYKPPRADTVRYGEEKYNNATTMLGLFRPPRLRHPGETPDEFKQQVRLAKEGVIPAREVLMHGVTGVTAMKFRLEDALGQKAYLGWHNGRLTDLTPDQRRDLQAAQHAIRTGSD